MTTYFKQLLGPFLKNTDPGLVSPPSGAVAVTPSDSVDLAKPIRGFMVTVAGTLKATFADGTVTTLPGLVPGAMYGALITRVWSIGTSATGIVGLY